MQQEKIDSQQVQTEDLPDNVPDIARKLGYFLKPTDDPEWLAAMEEIQNLFNFSESLKNNKNHFDLT